MPQATYLLWLDCRGLPVETQEELDDFMVSVAKVGMNSGTSFGEEGDRFLRLNVACPRSVLTEALERIERAVGALKA
jgi:cystathionine beta-lyase